MTLYANGSSWTASQLLEDVRRKARIPEGTLDFTTADLLREASAVITSFAGWAISKSQDGRELFQRQMATATQTLPGTYDDGREIMLPAQALGGNVDSVFWVDAGARQEHRLRPIELFDQPEEDTPNAHGVPWGYTIIGDRLRLYPRPSEGFVHINYQRRHPALIEDDDVAALAVAEEIDATTPTTVTIGTFGAPPPVLEPESYADLINSSYPYSLLAADCRIVSVGVDSVTLEMPPTLVTTPMVEGARIVLSGQSPYIHLPLEFQSCLAEKVAEKALRQIGDRVAADQCALAAETELARVMDTINPRSRSARQKIINRHSLLRTSRRWGWS